MYRRLTGKPLLSARSITVDQFATPAYLARRHIVGNYLPLLLRRAGYFSLATQSAWKIVYTKLVISTECSSIGDWEFGDRIRKACFSGLFRS